MSGGAQQVSQTSKVELSPEQRELMRMATPFLRQFAANPPQLPPFSRVAPFTPEQIEGQSQTLGAAPRQGALAEGAGTAANWFNTGASLFPESNPALRATIDAAVRPLQENLVSSTLPAIRSEFAGAGQYGGTRQGVAEGIASRGASQAMADAAAKVSTDAYQSGLDAMIKNLSLSPNISQMQLDPARSISAVGDVRQGWNQAALSELGSDWSYYEMLPYMMGSDLISLINGIPGAATTATGTMPRPDPLSQILGAGASILPMFF